MVYNLVLGGYMAKRFVVDDIDVVIEDNRIEISGEQVNHIKALRHEIGEQVNINNYLVEIKKISKEKIYGVILNKIQPKGIPSKNITLIQSYLKSDKMEYVVQKSVELGVSNVQPVISKNTVVKLDEKDAIKKIERLNKIAVEAVGQCGRTDCVKVEPVKKLNDIDFTSFDLVILCYEKATCNLADIENKMTEALNIAVIIGPEGGFDEHEIEILYNIKNLSTVLFGERILRAETASVYMLSILDYLSKK